jgi:hypothetical protein
MRTRPVALAVTAVSGLLYLATLSRHYTGDSIEYVLAQPGWLDGVLEYAGQQMASRVVVADAEAARANWWQEVLA